ncbi:MAG: GNAT family N-acetyltransferase [Polyangiaceae bacterium]|nr:GNAT family N-acetyltransferase [Polyangiaceae bacterium]
MGSEIIVRVLEPRDFAELVRIDAHSFGRPRPEYFKLKLKNTLEDTSVRVGLAAEVDGTMVGFLMGSMYFGDYGQAEPVATLESISVLPDFARKGVGSALWRQFTMNLKALRIDKVQTLVDWSSFDLLAFMRHLGFRPAPRLCLEQQLNFETDD